MTIRGARIESDVARLQSDIAYITSNVANIHLDLRELRRESGARRNRLNTNLEGNIPISDGDLPKGSRPSMKEWMRL